MECSSGKYWTREAPIQLSHIESKAYLSSSTSHQYGQPIPGQLEVAAAKSSSKSTYWIAQVIYLYIKTVPLIFFQRTERGRARKGEIRG